MITNKQSKKLFFNLSEAIGQKEFDNVKKFARYVKHTCLKKKIKLADANILFGYGGGKDSTWSLAFTRLAQLVFRQEFGETFNLHICSMVHLGTPRATLQNMQKVFTRLQVFDDVSIPFPQIYCYGQIINFTSDYKVPEPQKSWLREDILLAGQRSFGNGRATFCQTCNLHMVNACIYKLNQGMHFIITGDSTSELKSYHAWVQNILEQNNLLQLEKNGDCKNNIVCLQQIHDKFYSDLMPAANYYTSGRYHHAPVLVYLKFFFIPIFDFTKYSLKEHWPFFKNFLRFDFNDEILNFTETDCHYPLLMCHLRGILAECEERGYVSGVKEYLSVVKYFFNKKEFPKKLIEMNLNKFSSEAKINIARRRAESVFEGIGISKIQTVCLVYSPIAEKCKNLHKYLVEQAPEFLKHEIKIKKYLAGDGRIKDKIKKFLFTKTGLNQNLLRHLYLSPLFYPIYTHTNERRNNEDNDKNILNSVMKHDPHQKEVCFFDKNGEKIKEVIFGR
ncbi:MAG: hypothetical protein HZC05_00160 [Candidatus Magasanikbacteria bacterium]|nr:hypothetical protein [Candidatus Magasanikbacteria bacterium]